MANSSFDLTSKNKFHVCQVNLKPNIMEMKGNYRFYFISDGRDYAKTDDSESNHNSNFGWALSFDHFVAENIGLFLRYGKQKDDLTANTVTSAWSTGVSVNGNIWRRSDDFAGLGYGVVKKK